MLLAARYHLGERLVKDSTGDLFRARDIRHQRDVTVRVLTRGRPEHQTARRERLVREARILGGGRHPGLIRVYDLDVEHDPPYFVLEPLDGEPLSAWLARGNIPKLPVWFAWMNRLLGALGEVHRQGYLHRRLTTDYVFLTQGDGLKLFGLAGARSSESSESSGTFTTDLVPRYVAPEFLQSEAADPRSDLYSAAAIGFRMLTGSDALPVEEGMSPGAAIDLILRGTPFRASQLRPDLGLSFDRFFDRLLARDPERRPPNVATALQMLRKLEAKQDERGEIDGVRRVPSERPPPADSVAPPPTRIGDEIAGYRVFGKLGAGGAGAVLLARDENLKRNVALKLLGAPSPNAAQRVWNEAKAMASVSHPNVVQVYGVAEHAGSPVIVMEYVAGQTLEEHLQSSEGPMDLELAVSVLEQAATGLAAVHERGLVHADVKTSNVLLGPAGRVCVADFGLVAPNESFQAGPVQRVYGTPEYLAPERATGQLSPELASRVDVYALGVMAFELLTRRRLFPGRDAKGLIRAHISEEPQRLGELRPDLPLALEDVIARALEKDPAKRTASCLDFRTELLAAISGDIDLPPVPRRVLVVDDDMDFRAIMKPVILEAWPSAEVVMAGDGAGGARTTRATAF